VKKQALVLCICFFFLSTVLYAQLNYTLIPENPRPGEPITIAVTSPIVTHVTLLRGERQLGKAEFYPVPGFNFKTAVLAISSLTNPGEAVISFEYAHGMIMQIPITIADRTFAAETINLNPTLTGIRTDPSQQRVDESNHLWAILTTTGAEVYHTGYFIPPVSSTRRTSHFGDRRVFRYSTGSSDTSVHAGVDYGVPTGTRVIACGSGKVVLARSRIVTGNSVVIEHAPGIYSLYYHLDKIEAEEGSMVTAGTLIGLSGSTGLSTGPHLHWELRVNTENTDPDAFIGRPIVDKELIMSKLKIY
jgi:murein DD-endopeptidase MepM/ murein hydrolase activator NlpD